MTSMSPMPSTRSTDGGQTAGFSVFYVILGGAALLSIVIFPFTVMFALRHYRRGSLPTEQQQPGVLGDIDGRDLQQEEPKLFDVFVKHGLEVHEPKFEHILPMAVCTSEPHAPLATNAWSTPPNAPREDYSLRSRDRDAEKAEAPIPEDAFQIYDIAVLVVMPHPHAVNPWDELGEYAIGTTKLVIPVSSEDPNPPLPMYSILIPLDLYDDTS